MEDSYCKNGDDLPVVAVDANVAAVNGDLSKDQAMNGPDDVKFAPEKNEKVPSSELEKEGDEKGSVNGGDG